MPKIVQRVGIILVALLFLGFASALSIYVVVQAIQQHKNDASSSSQSATTQQPTFCDQNDTAGTTGQEKLPAPDVYKTTDKVTSLQTKDLTPGNGDTAQNGDCLFMKYYGTLANNGTLFDENFTKDTAFKFVLGAGSVIKGWDQGLAGMKVGGTRQLVIPANLAYGSQANGSIPANSDLVFVVKLLKVEKPKH